MAQENLKKFIEEEMKYKNQDYRLGQDEKIALDIIYERSKIPEEKRSKLTQEITQEIISNIYQGAVNGLKDRINNILATNYILIERDESQGKSSPTLNETKKAILKIKAIADRFSANRNLTIDYHVQGTPTLKLTDILKKEGL
ncbi:MAG: hypothetical protein NT139_02730 [Candidatus Woesearchaeota archaeon]|nr:hypothetical protein [Candidatus Woesearchaeota archaeon]